MGQTAERACSNEANVSSGATAGDTEGAKGTMSSFNRSAASPASTAVDPVAAAAGATSTSSNRSFSATASVKSSLNTSPTSSAGAGGNSAASNGNDGDSVHAPVKADANSRAVWNRSCGFSASARANAARS